jgi:ATP-dependent DNA helicase RecG
VAPELLALPGVGAARARDLAAVGITGTKDLLWWLPHRYEDRRHPLPLAALREGVAACVRVKVLAVKDRRAFRSGLHLTEALVGDESGSVTAVWFNQPWIKNLLAPGTNVFLYGRAGLFSVRGGLRLQLENPDVEKVPGPGEEPIHADRIVPVYRKAGAMGSKALRILLYKVLSAPTPWDEPLPAAVVKEEGLPPRQMALREVHFPSEDASLEALARAATPAQRRLVFEELLGLQCALLRSRQARQGVAGVVIRPSEGAGDLLRRILPFHLTKAQRRALKEITDDLAAPAPMYRLLHGDVGSGKTMVAFLAMVLSAHEGFQAAFMAPTEVLARQQYLKLKALAEGSGIEVGYLASSVKAAGRRAVLSGLETGRILLAVGTHSLFQEKVRYARLGLVVIDEQHRFGVEQRARLVAKGENPNVLVMTATPIPRSLAMTLYGDLDLSVLDELPPGRKPVVTALRDESSRHKVEAFLRREMDGGRQVFVVFPLVEESEETDLRAAVQAFERFQAGPFRGYSAALLHGRMAASEKEAVMQMVRSGEVTLLVATTVVEVGVDLPEASVIVVEHAERFGLAQLHQLRGRVGRGGGKGYCILMHGQAAGSEALDRLKVLEETGDGFAIAEADLAQRGPGDAGGVRQWGASAFRVANPLRDSAILQKARRWAELLGSPDFPWREGEREAFEKWLKGALSRWGSYGRIG